MIGFSLDPAPTHTGIAVWKDETVVAVRQTNWPNWVDMFGSILSIIGAQTSHFPDWIAAESSYYNRNAKVHAQLNRLLGAIEYWCYDNGIPYFEGLTTTIDSATGVFHKEDRKEQNRAIAELMLPGWELTEDECDAIAAGIWGYGKFKEWSILKNGLD